MSEECKKIMGILQRSGADQLDRTSVILDPNAIQLHGFGISEWMEFAYNFAKSVNYYEVDNIITPSGDWQDFFKNEENTILLLEELENSDQLTPHLTLFICFLKLLDLPKQRLNGLTKKHLDFFYQEVLQIDKIPAKHDRVHVIFELAKNIDQIKLSPETEMLGGKDDSGVNRIYRLIEEIAANKATVKELRNLYFHTEKETLSEPDAERYMKASPIANSYDGQGAEFEGEDTSWLPFGYYQYVNPNPAQDVSVLPHLPDAKIGFSVASNVLLLSEGDRKVHIDAIFENSVSGVTAEDLLNCISVYYTSEKKWIGPLNLSEAPEPKDEPSKDEEVELITEFNTYVSGNTIGFYFEIASGEKPVTAYNSEIHLESFDTNSPVVKLLVDVNHSSGAGVKVFKALKERLKTLDISVDVQGMKMLQLESDFGKLNAEKPVFPFTTTPVIGSSFEYGHEEIFSKNWTSLTTNIRWKNTPPGSFKKWYAAYQKSLIGSLSIQGYVGSQTIIKDETGGSKIQRALPGTNPVVDGDDYFEALTSIKTNDKWVEIKRKEKTASETEGGKIPTTDKVALFTQNGTENDIPVYTLQFDVENKNSIYPAGKSGPLRLSLSTTFMHELYPRLYATALVSQNPLTLIPNEPYTPLTDEVTLDYRASASLNIEETTEEQYNDREITLFHEHPFGQSVEHKYLRTLYNPDDQICSLCPKYNTGGELYIGLENAETNQTVSLLVQVSEGSEDPLADSFTSTDGVSWEILCNDHWKTLDSTYMVKNEIDNFLQSGLVQFQIPKEATSTNHLLDNGLHWVRAKMNKSYSAVCRVLGIYAQAGKAEFVNNGNDLLHLEKGIPGETIAKLVDRSSDVKTILQPYNSFNGKPEETDEAYYRRVSERIRHKQRAVNLWDYEHIILQEFNDIYRVKCLNHTRKLKKKDEDSFIAPGYVTIVVVPDTVDKNMFNIYQPRVSTAYLNEIQAYISQLTSLHVKTEVINPKYEEVHIEISVKFHDGYDRSLYEKELDIDLKKLLSPWAFDETKHVEFGLTLHRSVVIDYVERLEYVDYISDLKMKIDNNDFDKDLKPSSPKAILVSAEQHKVTSITGVCSTTQSTTEEVC